MNVIRAIALREFKAYFLTPIAYVYLIAFLVVAHWFFLRSFFLIGQSTLREFFVLMPWIYLFFVPAAAMGKWAEERKSGTIELILTLPISEAQVVLGKFFAGLGLLATALLLTFPLPLTVAWVGEIDLGPLAGGYLGLLLMGGAYLAIGLWVSSLTQNQIIAFILGVIACFALLIIGEPLGTMGVPFWLASLMQYLGLGSHLDSISRGVIDSRDILYYLSITGIFLFFNWKAVEAKG